MCLHIVEIDGVADDSRLNVVAKRLISGLRPYLESGEYRRLRFTITKNGEPPRSTYSIAPEPLP